jgi:hypothetical protein
VVQHLGFPVGRVNRNTAIPLDTSDLYTACRSLIEQINQPLVQGIDFVSPVFDIQL